MSRPTPRPRPIAVPPPGAPVTFLIRVTPSSSRTAVGGRRGDALVVRVTEAAVDGRATQAALRAVADALDLPRGAVQLRAGASSRDKLVDVIQPLRTRRTKSADEAGEVTDRVAALLGQRC